jgi:hypothetical protein
MFILTKNTNEEVVEYQEFDNYQKAKKELLEYIDILTDPADELLDMSFDMFMNNKRFLCNILLTEKEKLGEDTYRIIKTVRLTHVIVDYENMTSEEKLQLALAKKVSWKK